MELEKVNLLDLLKIIMFKKYTNKYQDVNIEDVYKETNKRFSLEYNLSIDDSCDNDMLYFWLKIRVGYKLLNELIDDSIKKINEHNTTDFFLKNFNSLNNIIKLQIESSLKDALKPIKSLKTVTKEETEEMFIEFLKRIDPSLEWLEIYNDAKKNKRIIYINELNEIEKEKLLNYIEIDSFDEAKNGAFYSDGNQFIWLTTTNNCSDLISLIHEFIHYIVNYKNNKRNTSDTLIEMPSIFYELYAHKFLLEKGFLQEEINLLNITRMQNTLYCASMIMDVFSLIDEYLKKGQIRKEDIIERKKNQVSVVREKIEKDFFDRFIKYNKFFLDYSFLEDIEWEKSIKKLLTLPDYVEVWYPYVLDTYFANTAIDCNNEDILVQMKYIVENLSILHEYDVLKQMGLNVGELGFISTNNINALK